MAKTSKTVIKTKVSTQTAIMVGVVALAALGIAAYGYGFGFGVQPSAVQRVQSIDETNKPTQPVVSSCKSLEFYWPYPDKTLDEIRKQLGYKFKWNDGEDVLFYRVWMVNTNKSSDCDIKIESLGVQWKGSVKGATDYRLMRVFPGGVEEQLSSGGKVTKGVSIPPSWFVLFDPVIIPASSNMSFTIRAINPKDANRLLDIVWIKPNNVTQRDSFDRVVEWGLSDPIGPTSIVVY